MLGALLLLEYDSKTTLGGGGGGLGLLAVSFNLLGLSSDPTALALNNISTWTAIGCR